MNTRLHFCYLKIQFSLKRGGTYQNVRQGDPDVSRSKFQIATLDSKLQKNLPRPYPALEKSNVSVSKQLKDYFLPFRSLKVEQIFIKKHNESINGAFDDTAIFLHYKRLGERVLSLKRFFVQLCGVVPMWKTEKRESSLSLLQHLPN